MKWSTAYEFCQHEPWYVSGEAAVPCLLFLIWKSTPACNTVICTGTLSFMVSYQEKKWQVWCAVLLTLCWWACSSQHILSFSAGNSILHYLHRLFSMFFWGFFTPFTSQISHTNLANSTASPYTSWCCCSPQRSQDQLIRPSQSETWLRGWCKARNQSPPGWAAAETQSLTEAAEHPWAGTRPSASHVQNAGDKSRGQ